MPPKRRAKVSDERKKKQIKRHISNILEKENPLSDCTAGDLDVIPTELLIAIFRKISLRELLSQVSLVCKKLYILCNDPKCWFLVELRKWTAFANHQGLESFL